MFALDSLPPAALPAGVVVIGAATFWLVLVGLFAAAVAVRVVIAAALELLSLLRESRQPVRHLRLVKPKPAS
ncbi:hypothetical protein K2Z84_07290 [Candidatus Binatia bacterium]|jgi:hypothetical protein|nr:hypothetical protein [Candidatus Binatia bacterium]